MLLLQLQMVGGHHLHPLYFQFSLLSSFFPGKHFAFSQPYQIFSTLSNQFHRKLLGLIRQYVVSSNKIQN